jgi:hypothetical protein
MDELQASGVKLLALLSLQLCLHRADLCCREPPMLFPPNMRNHALTKSPCPLQKTPLSIII